MPLRQTLIGLIGRFIQCLWSTYLAKLVVGMRFHWDFMLSSLPLLLTRASGATSIPSCNSNSNRMNRQLYLSSPWFMDLFNLIYPSIHPPTCSFIHYPFIHLSLHSFTCPSICSSTLLSIHPPTHPPIHPFIHLSIHPPLHSFTYPSIHPPIHPSIYPPIHLSIHLSIYLCLLNFCVWCKVF